MKGMYEIAKGRQRKFNDTGLFWTPCNILKLKCFLNVVIGGRATGKTFSLKRYTIDDFLKTKNKFVYVRIFDSEINPAGYFEKICNFYPEHKFFYMNGKKSQPATLFIDDEICGYMVSLKTAYKIKSTDFTNITTILWDEFLPPVGTAGVPDGIGTMFMELLSTFIREEDIPNSRIFMLANAVSFESPMVEYLGLPVEDFEDFKGKCIKISDSIALEYLETSKEFIENMKETKLGKLFKELGHWDYAVENKFLIGILPENRTLTEKEIENFNFNSSRGVIMIYNNYYIVISETKKGFNCFHMSELPEKNFKSSSYIFYTRQQALMYKNSRAILLKPCELTESLWNIYKVLRENRIYYNNQKAFSTLRTMYNIIL